MTITQLIMLMGIRGSGKTTVGRLVADRLGLGFVDLDDVTPMKMGVADAAEAIRTLGFDAFRSAEAEALRGVLSGEPRVIALGGGTPTAPEAAGLMRGQKDRGADIVYLHARPGVLRERLSGTDTASRPSLTGAGMLDEIESMYLDRDPLYRELCSRLVETEGLTTAQIAAMIG